MTVNFPTVNLSGQPAYKPMGIGEIIRAGWRFYIANFVRNMVISAKGTLWSIAPVVVALVAALLFVQQVLGAVETLDRESLQPYLLSYRGLFIFAAIALCVFSLYCLAQSLGYFLAISRLSFQALDKRNNKQSEPIENELSQNEGQQSQRQPRESERAALRVTRSRKFAMLKAVLLQSLILFAAYIAIVLTLTLLATAAANLFNVDAANESPNLLLYALIGLLGAVAILVALCIFVWLVVRLMLVQQPLAIESRSSAMQAISRSWQVTRQHVGRTLLVALLAILISFPVSIVVYVMSNAIVVALFGAAATLPGKSPESITIFIAATLASMVISSLSSIVVTPFWYSTLAALYFDLSNRLRSSTVAIRESVPVSSS